MNSSLKILVADDSLTYRMMIQELLEDSGYEVFLATNGNEALQIFEKHAPDLVILDIIMPEKTGMEVCHFLKKNPKTHSIPIILLTSMDASADRIEGLDSGADEYLTKPFHEEELLAKIRSLVRLRTLQGNISYSAFSKSMVLVADDSMTIRMNLSELLEDEGDYQTLLAKNGEDAVEMVKHNLPDLVILDVVMPVMDGIEACRQIKSNPATQQVPVIIITSRDNVDDKIRGLNAGADDYLYKPYNPKELIAKVNAIFRMKKIQLEAERNILARSNLELQNINEQLKKTQMQLIQTEKIAGLGQLVAGIAHEINNPLAFISNNLHLCQEAFVDYTSLLENYQQYSQECSREAPLHSESQKKLQMIQALEKEIDIDYLKTQLPLLYKHMGDGMLRIRNIILGLRNFSRLDEAEQKRVDVTEGIESTLHLIQHHLKNRIEVVKDYQNHPAIECFPSQLNQVFMNVLINASQAIHKKGIIKISLFEETDNGNLCIQIKDNGKGMSEEVLNHIFDPFFTTKDVGEGTGLGLSISYGIIEKHKGSIHYSSILNQGTTCLIKIPMN